jgi:outer membrane protein assembly factor BamD (BamD/ComL family)
LFEQQRFIEAARAASARGDARAALSVLDSYDRAHARKQFGPEALALRVEALRASGQTAAARNLATDFARLYPSHPLLPRVQGAVQR